MGREQTSAGGWLGRSPTSWGICAAYSLLAGHPPSRSPPHLRNDLEGVGGPASVEAAQALGAPDGGKRVQLRQTMGAVQGVEGAGRQGSSAELAALAEP